MKNIPLYEVRAIKNIKDMLNSSAEIYKDNTAYLSKKHPGEPYSSITFGKFKEDVDFFGTALINAGLKGKTIAIIGENRYEWSITYMATLCGTGVIVPLDKELPIKEIATLIIRSNADAVVFSPSVKDNINAIKDLVPSVKRFICMAKSAESDGYEHFYDYMAKGKELVGKGDRSFIDAEIDNDEMSVLLFTSGTTDKAKGVMLSHKNLAVNLMSMSSMLYISPNDIFLSILPIHHTYECTCGFLCPMYRGSAVAYSDGLRHIPKNMVESRASIVLGVPLIFEMFHKRIWAGIESNGMGSKVRFAIKLNNALKMIGIDLSKKLFKQIHDNFGGNLNIFISGAAGIDPLVGIGFRDIGIKLLQGYGLTECSPIAALNRDCDFKFDAAGLPLPGCEIKIDNASNDGNGEIIIKGENVMLGYFENPEANATTIIDGWFYSGDLGFIDKDGFVHITGRIKNVIITKNGKNIYPEEIEELLTRSVYIKECVIKGKQDENDDDVVVTAIIVPDMDRFALDLPEGNITPEIVYNTLQDEIKKVNKSLTTYKYVKDFVIQETEFEKTTSKKIKRSYDKV